MPFIVSKRMRALGAGVNGHRDFCVALRTRYFRNVDVQHLLVPGGAFMQPAQIFHKLIQGNGRNTHLSVDTLVGLFQVNIGNAKRPQPIRVPPALRAIRSIV